MGPRELLVRGADSALHYHGDQRDALAIASAEEGSALLDGGRETDDASASSRKRLLKLALASALAAAALAALLAVGHQLRGRAPLRRASHQLEPMGKIEGNFSGPSKTKVADERSFRRFAGDMDEVQGLPSSDPASWGNEFDGIWSEARAQCAAWGLCATTTTTTTTTTSTWTRTTTSTRTNTTTATGTSTVSTTTTTSLCEVAQDGDDCFSEVVQILHRLASSPDEYENLTIWSTFEDVQMWLHRRGEDAGVPSKCTLPCECTTAAFGDDCYNSVMWSYEQGISDHPEQFQDISAQSSFEDVQKHRHLFADDGCPEPCRPGYLAQETSLFCFSICRPDGYERKVLEAQLAHGRGIFACDAFAALSSEVFSLGKGPRGTAEIETTKFDPAKVGVSKDGTATNALLFMHAWNVIENTTLALQYDWILKVEPDAVILPDRLRKHLASHVGSKSYVRNCNAYPESPDFPAMFGSLEVLSRTAMMEYFTGGAEICKKKLDWKQWGEDHFVGKCMDLIGVQPIDNFDIISDDVCRPVDCSDPVAGAFHPFKDVDAWTDCWNRATRSGRGLLQPLPALTFDV